MSKITCNLKTIAFKKFFGEFDLFGINLTLKTLYRLYHNTNFKDRGNQYIPVGKDPTHSLLLGISKQLPTFLHRVQGSNH